MMLSIIEYAAENSPMWIRMLAIVRKAWKRAGNRRERQAIVAALIATERPFTVRPHFWDVLMSLNGGTGGDEGVYREEISLNNHHPYAVIDV